MTDTYENLQASDLTADEEELSRVIPGEIRDLLHVMGLAKDRSFSQPENSLERLRVILNELREVAANYDAAT